MSNGPHIRCRVWNSRRLPRLRFARSVLTARNGKPTNFTFQIAVVGVESAGKPSEARFLGQFFTPSNAE